MRTLDLTLSLLCLAGIGCSAPVSSTTEADAETSTPASAVVVVERTVSAGESARAEAVARFVRMRTGSVDQEALRMVGAAIDLPAMGSCVSLVATRAPAPASPRDVELADLGPITVEAAGAHVSLQPRRLPDVVDLVSGVVYSSRASAPEALPADAPYLLRASGGSDVDVPPFTVSATAPAEPTDIFVGGQDVRRAGGVTLPAEGAVDVSWSPGSAEDVVYVDVTQSSSAGPRNVRCLFEDSGRGVVSAAALGDGEGTLTLHRFHREPFVARGIDAGEIRFDFARSVTFRR